MRILSVLSGFRGRLKRKGEFLTEEELRIMNTLGTASVLEIDYTPHMHTKPAEYPDKKGRKE